MKSTEHSLDESADESRRIFPTVPASWFHIAHVEELRRKPVALELGGTSFVAFITVSGNIVVLSAKCSHMGANLGGGRVCGENIVCPLHGWAYGPEGECRDIPASNQIPEFARQISYPAAERGGHVFFFNRPAPRFPFPFFEGVEPAELIAARPFELIAEAPWYFVGANGFDVQHFRMAHDRTLVDQPQVSSPAPFARRVVATFEVSGHSFQDAATRKIAGPRVKMDVTVWCGTVILVRATFDRTESFGIFNVLPIDAKRTRGRVIVWMRRNGSALGRAVLDPVSAAIRRMFIQRFLQADLPRIAGLRYHPGRLIAADGILADYFAWLEKVAGNAIIEAS